MTEYVLRVRDTPSGYRATLRQVAHGCTLDAVTAPGSTTAVGVASTAPAAILQAVISARLPVLGSQTLPGPSNGSEAARSAPEVLA